MKDALVGGGGGRKKGEQNFHGQAIQEWAAQKFASTNMESNIINRRQPEIEPVPNPTNQNAPANPDGRNGARKVNLQTVYRASTRGIIKIQ